MPNEAFDVDRRALQRTIAISVWENEGGRGYGHRQTVRADAPYMVTTELIQLRVRIIALENLVVALLAAPSDQRLDLARELANYISPRAGFTPHHLTVGAANQMIHLVERAGDLCAIQS